MTQKQIIQDIELDNGLKLVAQAFTELSSINLQRIRARIERNRVFFEEVSGLFASVQRLADKRGIVPKLGKKGTVGLILTSNNKFYGGLERRLMLFFEQTLSKIPAEKILIGHSAADYFKTNAIIFHQDLPNEAELRNLTETLKNFSQVLVFYPRFQSVLLQKPFLADLTHSGTTGKSQTSFPVDYILEPEIEKMWQFFDNQILKLLLEQTFLESELARTAARLTSMDQAQDRADKIIKELKKNLGVVKKSLNNNRILEIESAMFTFRRKNDLR